MTAGSIFLCAVGIAGAWLLMQGAADAGDIVAAIWLAVQLRGPVNRLTQSNVIHQRAAVAVDRVQALLKRTPESPDNQPEERFTGDRQRIRLKNIAYRGVDGAWVIRGFDATFQGPGMVVVRGSRERDRVLQELVLRLRRPHEGRVALDGRHARRYPLEDIRARIGWLDERRLVAAMRLALGPDDSLREAWETCGGLAPTMSIEDVIEAARPDPNSARIWGGDLLARELLALACAVEGDRPILLLDTPARDLTPDQREGVYAWLCDQARRRLLIVFSDDPKLLACANRVVELGAPQWEADDTRNADASPRT